MKHSQNQKFVIVTSPAAIVDNAAFTTAAIDTKGFTQLTILAIFGAMDIAVASASVRHSNASNMSSPATLSTGGTDFTLPTATADDTILGFDIDLRGRKRYLDFEITGGDGTAGTYLSVIAILSRASTGLASAADRGLSAAVTV
jgi:hypothetical protein